MADDLRYEKVLPEDASLEDIMRSIRIGSMVVPERGDFILTLPYGRALELVRRIEQPPQNQTVVIKDPSTARKKLLDDVVTVAVWAALFVENAKQPVQLTLAWLRGLM